jgi:hypothetical protein
MTNKQIEKSQGDFNFAIMKTAELFGEMDGGAKRNALSAKLLGRGYQTVLPLFSKGKKGLQEYLGWADKYNVTMGDEAVDATVDLAQAQRESKVAWMGIQNVLATKYIPSLIDANEKFQALAQVLTDPSLTRDEKLTIVGGLIERGFSDAFDWITNVGLPKLAENVGQTAPKIAAGFARGFMNANVIGKIAIGYWLISKLVGGKLLSKIALAGATAATGWLTAFVGTIGTALLGTRVGLSLYMFFGPGGTFRTKMGPLLKAAGGWAGRLFALGFITLGAAVIWDKRFEIWDVIDDVMPDWVKDIPGLSDAATFGAKHIFGTVKTQGTLDTSALQGTGIGSFDGKGGKGPDIPNDPSHKRQPRAAVMMPKKVGDQEITIHNHTYLDGKQVAESVEHHVMREAARR